MTRSLISLKGDRELQWLGHCGRKIQHLEQNTKMSMRPNINIMLMRQSQFLRLRVQLSPISIEGRERLLISLRSRERVLMGLKRLREVTGHDRCVSVIVLNCPKIAEGLDCGIMGGNLQRSATNRQVQDVFGMEMDQDSHRYWPYTIQ